MGIKKPVFIIGVARSGTTVTYNMFATHPQVAWFSNYSNLLRAFPQAPVLHRAFDLPWLGEKLRRNIIDQKGSRLTPRPNEGEEIYQEICGIPYNTGLAQKDAYPQEAEKLKQVFESHLKYSHKSIFISKQTANNRRLHLLDSIFPDARYIHIIRDGRAVALSLTKKEWWRDIEFWWSGQKAGEVEGDPLTMLMEYWDRVHGEIQSAAPSLGDRYTEFRYEDIVTDVHGTMSNLVDFLGWEPNQTFIERLPKTLPNMNHKWRTELNDSQKETAVRLIGPRLQQYGYDLE